jgi:hypothetical protein
MRKIFIAILTLLSINSFGQQWTEYQVDSTLTLTIPDNFEVTDTVEQRIITAQVDNGLILVTVIPNNGKTAINVQDEKDLLDSYRGFKKGSIDSQKGQLIKEEIIEKNGLKFIRFSFSATTDGEKQKRHCLVIFVNNKIYSLNFWELESMTNEMADVREKFFSSLILPNDLTLKNQMNDSIEGSRAYQIGHFIGYSLGLVLTFGLIVSIVIWITRKVRR